jgi:hypothetical protein
MTDAVSSVLRQALDLDPDDRAKVAAELLASLDDVHDDVEKAWAEEISRRSALAADQRGVDWRSVLDEIETEILRR